MKLNKTFLLIPIVFLLVSCGKETEETQPVRKDVTEMVFASGTLQANNTYSLTAQTDGYLTKVSFEEGDIIEAGQVLGVIYNPENLINYEGAFALYQIAESNTNSSAPAIEQAKNNVQSLKRKLEYDSIQFVRYKSLFEKNAVSKSEFDSYLLQYNTSQTNYLSAVENYKIACQQSEQNLISSKISKDLNLVMSSNNEIKAVVSGKVFQKFKQPGDFVRKGDVIATIGDPDMFYAVVSIDEGSVSKIKIGQKAIISLNPIKDRTYQGVVAEIFPSFDEANQSFTCKLLFSDSLDFRVINTQLQTNIIVGETKNALLIPRNYLKFGDFVQVKGKDEPVKIKTRIVSSDWVLIEDGIDENDIIITDKIK